MMKESEDGRIDRYRESKVGVRMVTRGIYQVEVWMDGHSCVCLLTCHVILSVFFFFD
jgi:hypothetical protein